MEAAGGEETVRVDPKLVEAREIDGEIVIYDLRERRYLGGNAAATLLWPLLSEGTTVSEMADRMEAEFGIDRARACDDAAAFAAELRRFGLLDSAP